MSPPAFSPAAFAELDELELARSGMPSELKRVAGFF
jgi:hypothetical protein